MSPVQGPPPAWPPANYRSCTCKPKARYENGVLWLTLPKKLEAATHRVLIN